MSGSPTLRIGIDTGGTFTDIVCVDDASGAMRVTKVSSTPANPAIALVRGVHAILGESGASIDDLAVLAHGTTVATNALLQGEIAGLGLIVTDGFRHILEIARQAVPEGYGNSYFWVKPERIVPLRFVREIGGRLNFLGEELRPLDEDSVRAAARFFRSCRHQRRRHLSSALLCQPGARTPRRRDRPRRISGLHAVGVLRRAARSTANTSGR